MMTLTSKEIQQAWEKLALKDYEFFLTYTGRKQWKTAKHLKLVCKKLEAVELLKQLFDKLEEPPTED